MSDVGLVAKLIETVFSWCTDEAGLAAFRKRREVEALKKELHDAIDAHDYAAVRKLLAELKRLSDAP